MPFYRESYMVTEREEQEYANYQSAEIPTWQTRCLEKSAKTDDAD